MPFEITLEKPDQTSAPPRSDTSTAPATPTPETTDFQARNQAAIQEEEQRISALKSALVAEGFPTESIADIRALILSRAQDTSDATIPRTMTEINRIVSMHKRLFVASGTILQQRSYLVCAPISVN